MWCSPLYNELAEGAVFPTGRQMTIRWWCHLSKETLLIDLGGQVFHLSRKIIREPHFIVIGELRDAESLDGLDSDLLETVVNDGKDDTAYAVPEEDRRWLEISVHSQIVVRLETKMFHTRISNELHGVASPVLAFCLGAHSLMCIETFEKVLTHFARTAEPIDRKDVLEQQLRSALEIEVSLTGSAEWHFPDNDWHSQKNLLGYAYARVALPDTTLSFRRVIVIGLEGQKNKMYYFGVTALGALNDDAVKLYNNGAVTALARKQATNEQAKCAWEFFQKECNFFLPTATWSNRVP